MTIPSMFSSAVFSDFEQMRRDLNSLFDSEFSRQSIRNSARNYPPLSVAETDEDVRVYLFAAGFKAEDFDVSIQSNVLSVTCARKDDEKSENREHSTEAKKVFYRNERPYGKFTRVLSLPDSVDSAQVHANYQNGVLNVFVGKRKESLSRKVEVKS